MSRDRTNILFIFETNCNWFCVVWSKKTEGQRLVKRNLALPATLMDCLPSVRIFASTTSCSRLAISRRSIGFAFLLPARRQHVSRDRANTIEGTKTRRRSPFGRTPCNSPQFFRNIRPDLIQNFYGLIATTFDAGLLISSCALTF